MINTEVITPYPKIFQYTNEDGSREMLPAGDLPLSYYKTEWPPKILQMHPYVKKVLDFMEREIPPDDCRGVAEAVALLSPALWAMWPYKRVPSLILRERPPQAAQDEEKAPPSEEHT